MKQCLQVCLLALAILAIGTSGVFARHRDRSNSCYPANEWQLLAGALRASSEGEATIGSAEIEIPPSDDGLSGSTGMVEWKFSAKVGGNVGTDRAQTAGSMGGRLEIEIDWDDEALGTTRFKADCIAEITSESDSVEAEFEGWIYNFPDERTKRYGVASVVINEEGSGGVARIHVALEFGRTCFEHLEVFTTTPSFNEFEIEFTTTDIVEGEFKTDVVGTDEPGRASLPPGYPVGGDLGTQGDEVCPGVFL